jgi:hypothetical protein
VVGGVTRAVQRALKVSTPMAGSGDPSPQSKLMTGSMRVIEGPLKSMLS